MNIKPISDEDVIVWPDGFWVFRSELPSFSHRSDDYMVIPAESPDWHNFLEAQEA